MMEVTFSSSAGETRKSMHCGLDIVGNCCVFLYFLALAWMELMVLLLTPFMTCTGFV